MTWIFLVESGEHYCSECLSDLRREDVSDSRSEHYIITQQPHGRCIHCGVRVLYNEILDTALCGRVV